MCSSGIMLFSPLSVIISRQMGNEGSTTQLAADKVEVLPSQAINRATAVKYNVRRMIENGPRVEGLNFVVMGESGYDTGSHMPKVFYPGGVGAPTMTMQPELNSDVAASWAYQNRTASNGRRRCRRM